MASSLEDRISMLEAEVARKTQWVIDLEVELSHMTKPHKTHVEELELEKDELEDELGYLTRVHNARVQDLEFENGEKDHEISDLKAQTETLRSFKNNTTDKMHGLSLELADKRSEVTALQQILKVQDARIHELNNTNAALRTQVEQSIQLMEKHHQQREMAEYNLKASKKASEILRIQETDFSSLMADERQKIATLYAQVDEATKLLQKKDQHCSELKKELKAVIEHAQGLEAEAENAPKLNAEMNGTNVVAAHAKLPMSVERKKLATESKQPEANPQLKPKSMPGAGINPFKYDNGMVSMTKPALPKAMTLHPMMAQHEQSFGKPITTPTNPEFAKTQASQNLGISSFQKIMSQHQQSSSIPITNKPAPTKITLPKGPPASFEPMILTLSDIKDPLAKKQVGKMAIIFPDVTLEDLLNAFLDMRGDYDKAFNFIVEQREQRKKLHQLMLSTQGKAIQREPIGMTPSDDEYGEDDDTVFDHPEVFVQQ